MRWRVVALVAVAACALFAPALGPSAAQAATLAQINSLQTSSCPDYDEVAKTTGPIVRLSEAKGGTFYLLGHPTTLVPPVDWKQDPYNSISWRHRLHDWHWIDPLLRAYDEQGDTAALAQARDLMIDWMENNPEGGPGVDFYAWFDKPVADRSAYFAYIARAAACEHLLSNAQAGEIIDGLIYATTWLADPAHYNPHHNHGLFSDLGLILLTRYLPFLPDSSEHAVLAVQRFGKNLSGRLALSEGVFLEHSPAYQLSAESLLRLMAGYAPFVSEQLLKLAERMNSVASWMVMPDGALTQLGDTNLGKVNAQLARRAKGRRGMKIFWQGGFAFVRTPRGYLSISAGFHSTAHKQQDDSGFELYEQGRRIVTDTGSPGTDGTSSAYLGRIASAHSVLSVNGPTFKGQKPYGSGIKAAGAHNGWYAIQTINPRLKAQRVDHRRLFLYKPGTGLIVVDRADGKQRVQYRRYLQVGTAYKADKTTGGVKLRSGPKRATVFDKGNPTHLRIWRGDKKHGLGLTYPFPDQGFPRPTLVFTSPKAKRLRSAMSIGTGKSICASVARWQGKKIVLGLRINGARKVMTITRSGTDLKPVLRGAGKGKGSGGAPSPSWTGRGSARGAGC